MHLLKTILSPGEFKPGRIYLEQARAEGRHVPREKVFCIGFHKTGTTSMGMALSRLGYRVTGPNHVYDKAVLSGDLFEIARPLLKRFDAFQDNPWPLLFREVAELHPDAKFILTTRDPQDWIRSQVGHFKGDITPMRARIYGSDRASPLGNETHYIDTMERHNDAVRSFFVGSRNFLEMKVSDEDAWGRICNLLGVEIPDTPFPHGNGADARTSQQASGARRLARALLKR